MTASERIREARSARKGLHQCRICLRYFGSVNDLAAHSQSLFKCERYDMDAIRYWAARSK